MLEAKWASGKFLCVGLDPDIEKIPEEVKKQGTQASIIAFNRAIIDSTLDIVCAYKLNSAFYEVHGDEGWSAMRNAIAYLLEAAPDVPVILDAKRADIGSTSEAYAQAAFDHLRADAITVNPYLGFDGLKPFFDRREKGIFVLCHTSNDNAGEIQELKVEESELYKVVAQKTAHEWNKNGNACIVMGATHPEQLAEVRKVVGDIPMLIPGVGVQGGDVEKLVAAGKNSKKRGFLINVSRSVLYASQKDFANAARGKSKEIDGMIRAALKEVSQ